MRTGALQLATPLVEALLTELGFVPRSSRIGALIRIAANRIRIRLRGYRFEPIPATTLSRRDVEVVDTLGVLHRELALYDPIATSLTQSRFVRAAVRMGEPVRVVQALCYEALFAAFLGRAATAERLLNRVRVLALRLDHPQALASRHIAEAGCALLLGRVNEVLAAAYQGHELLVSHCPGTHWETYQLATFRYGAMLFCGSIRALCEEAYGLSAVASERNDRFLQGVLLLAMCTRSLAEDQPQEAVRLARAFLAQQDSSSYTIFTYFASLRVVDALLYTGDVDEAIDFYRRARPRLRQSAFYRGRQVWLSDHWVCARLALCAHVQRPEAGLLRAASRAVRVLEGRPGLDADVWAACTRAALERQRGRNEVAIAVLSAMLAGCETAGLLPYASYARYGLGALVSGPKGRGFREQALQDLQADGVRNPQGWIGTYVPGFD